MAFDYLAAFPIPRHAIPQKLRGLLEPVGLSPRELIQVACMHESSPDDPRTECLHLQMAVVPGIKGKPIETVDEAGDGVVQSSAPTGDIRGCSKQFTPSISGYDYIVAAWGSGSFYSYSLAEKVCMLLELTSRCVGNDEQRLIYDDPSLPEFGVAQGEVSTEYNWNLKKNVTWTMTNEYLRRYLWLRGSRGVRVFYYEALLSDTPTLRVLMEEKSHSSGHKPTDGVAWYDMSLMDHQGGILLQVWASVEAVMPELCPEQTTDSVLWPGDTNPTTHTQANSIFDQKQVYLDDKFLEKYEQSKFYDSTPTYYYNSWHCSPSYKNQWSFTDCRRVGRNLIRVPLRELYTAKTDREILHAHSFALDPATLAHVNMHEEHIVAKTQRLLDALLLLGDELSMLGITLNLCKSAQELVGFSRTELIANGWLAYPALSKLAQVAPLDMTQQDFLARCKSLHEIWQRIPNGFLKSLLERAGCPKTKVKDLGSIKLLQALFNIVERLNAHEETVEAFTSANEPEAWLTKNEQLAPLFLNNDLRIADAHETVEGCLTSLRQLGFDTANVNTGYGRALDFVMDGVIKAMSVIGQSIKTLLTRQ